MKLQGAVEDLPLRLGMPELGGRGLVGGKRAGEVPFHRPVQVRPADLQLRRHFRQPESRVLELDHPLAERGAALGELYGLVEGALRRGLGAYGDR